MTIPKVLTRRTALKGLGVGALALSAPAYLKAASNPTIRIGFVSPQTGAMGSFGETDAYALDFIRKHIGAGLDIRGTTYAVEIIERDSQSNANRAAEVAGELILNEEVQIIIPASTTDVTLPVSEQAELNGVPSVSSTAPWQAVIMPRGGDAFEWTYHFFWGLEDIIASFVNMWSSAETNKKVGLLLPRNTDGEVWGSEEFGLPPALRAAGFEVVKPSLFEPRTNDFSAQIAAFKSAGCDILGGLVFPGDLRTAAIQCAQQGFKPKIATIAAGLLFPSAVEALGSLGNGMSTEVWWTPAFPYASTLTGESSAQLAATWEEKTRKQWTQPLGYSHAIWEVVLDTLKRAEDPLDRASVRDALKATDLTTMVGKVKWANGPHPNVSKTPILGGQWRKGEKWPYDLKIVEAKTYPIMEPQAKLEMMSWQG
ncbi:ABC transporter substrate-binding protein [Ferranicluibacter rubi]|uniref:ABC transporter substrate-binding protein n=1 Tax=Ferranicluibacter rubi TaxID=2715133 RepID=A0AA43ZEM1_9HYPH|nr:ABC transporter substrate-binding protein [Ferranicluibacter rubi]NHT75701.1 ABC transporter substrate-binding protein [Ferranicluibacter rubi]TCP88346.1 amino acid/amide ABC transporter substrate-binding protein (HAAT family) [Rhizobium sp. PP-CC-2G-626]TCQ22989.1 amino acid/amide ABC transporter substrate-binding protein (HAAT family) [Rhizobium sp. PP-CC-3G-465]